MIVTDSTPSTSNGKTKAKGKGKADPTMVQMVPTKANTPRFDLHRIEEITTHPFSGTCLQSITAKRTRRSRKPHSKNFGRIPTRRRNRCALHHSLIFILLTTCLAALQSSGCQGESRGRGGEGEGDGRVTRILNDGGGREAGRGREARARDKS
jgi:hypothetical protein